MKSSLLKACQSFVFPAVVALLLFLASNDHPPVVHAATCQLSHSLPRRFEAKRAGHMLSAEYFRYERMVEQLSLLRYGNIYWRVEPKLRSAKFDIELDSDITHLRLGFLSDVGWTCISMH